MLTLEGHAGAVHTLVFSPHGELLASGGIGGSLRLWSPSMEAIELNGHTDILLTTVFSLDGHYLVSGGSGRALRVWDTRKETTVASWPQMHHITAAALVSPGTVLFGVGDRSSAVAQPTTLFLVDLPTGKPRRLGFDVVHGIRALAALPDRKLAAWVTDRKILRVQDVSRPPSKPFILSKDCRAIAMSSDGRRLAVTSDWDLLVFDIERWPEMPKVLGRHQGTASSVVFAPDGRTLLSGGWDNVVRVWDVDRRIEKASFTWPIGNRVNALAVSPDGMRAAAAGDAGTIVVWDLE